MLYSEESYPAQMEHLTEDMRRKAIQFTNEMLLDSDIRYHKDFIILKAIQKARQSVTQEKGGESKLYS